MPRGRIIEPIPMILPITTKKTSGKEPETGILSASAEQGTPCGPMAAIRKKLLGVFLLVLVAVTLCGGVSRAEENGVKVTKEMIYQKLLQMEKTQAIFGERLEQIDERFELVDRRFEQIDKRFEQVDKRFEQVDKRISELREDMNNRFSELRDDMNKRFEQLFTFLWIITGIFTTLVVAVFGFAWWDRKTVIMRAKQESVEEVERRLFSRLLNALRELAKEDKKLADALRLHGLL